MSEPGGEVAGPGPEIRTPVGDAPVVAVIMLGTGMYLAWFGTHYWRSDVKWPTDPVKAVLQGKGLPPATRSPSAAPDIASGQAGIGSAAGSAVSGVASGAAGIEATVGSTAAHNQFVAKLLAAAYGWNNDPYWSALVRLWNSESSWDNTIWNTSASCGGGAYAYGIPQACGHGERKTIPGHGEVCPFPPGNKGNPPECGGNADPASQISWGLSYIKQNYGDPTRVPLGGY